LGSSYKEGIVLWKTKKEDEGKKKKWKLYGKGGQRSLGKKGGGARDARKQSTENNVISVIFPGVWKLRRESSRKIPKNKRMGAGTNGN